MRAIMRCVAEAVVAKGLLGLADLVPGGKFLLDVAEDAFRRMRERKKPAELSAEFASAAAASFDQAKDVAAEIVRQVVPTAPPDQRQALELYLTQIPGTIRASLKRPEDPSGRSVPAAFALTGAADLARRLPARPPRFRPGEALPGKPGWELVELLGTGGFGEVWLARNPSLSALKGAVKFGLDPDARERLLRHEGTLVNRVMEQGKHPNVVQLLDAQLAGDAPWLMYEYVSGGDLTGLVLAWQLLPPGERVRKATAALHTLAAAVGYFHRLGPPLVHRDLKPANVLVEAGILKVGDFGIGGVAAATALAQETNRRGSTGILDSQLYGSHTLLYASPQQQRGNAPDPRDDVHALGVIAFQMLTGRLDQAPGVDFAKILLRTGVPADLIELIGDCCAHDATSRPRDAKEVEDRLSAFAPASVNVELHDDHIRVACPACAAKLKVPESKLGREVGCPKCRHRFTPRPATATPGQSAPPVVPPVYQPQPTWNPAPIPTAVPQHATPATRLAKRVPDANPFDSLDDENDDEPAPRSRTRAKRPRRWRYVAAVGVGLLVILYVTGGFGRRNTYDESEYKSNDWLALQSLGVAYHSYVDEFKKSPDTAADLVRPLLGALKSTKERSGPSAEWVHDKLKDGSYVLHMGVSPDVLQPISDPANTVLGYERFAPQYGGLVLMADGSVRRMSRLEFSVAKQAKGGDNRKM